MIINPISKGGKGLLPEITVTAPSGSTLDLIQGSVVLQTYTLSSTETQHTFTVKNIGTYTIRGTNESNTKSVDVVIDTIGQYSCTIEYILKLYWYGDECEDITGGWSSNGYTSYYTPKDGTKYDDHMHVAAESGKTQLFGTGNIIDMADYRTLHFIVDDLTVYSGDSVYFVVASNKNNADGINGTSQRLAFKTVGACSEPTELILDISSVNSGYVYFYTVNYTPRSGDIYSVWLE